MFYFVLLMIAVTNLGLGYAVATHFGFGPKPLDEVDAARAKALAALPTFSIEGGDVAETPLDELPPAEPLPEEPAVEESSASEEQEVADEDTNDDPTDLVEDLDITEEQVEQLADEMDAAAAVETEEVAVNEDPAEPVDDDAIDDAEPTEDGPEQFAAALDEVQVDRTAEILEDCHESLTEYRERVVSIDDRMHSHTGDEPAPVAECVDDLHDANRQYLEAQEERLEDLAARDASSLPAEQQAAIEAVESQYTRVRESQETIEAIEEDQPKAIEAVFIETRKLAAASDAMRDRLNAALRIASSRRNMTSEEVDALETDPLTDLVTRRSFDKAVAKAWQRGPSESSTLSVVLIDVDRFESFNVAHGPHTGDQALRAVADIVKGEVSSHDLAARFAGPQIAVLSEGTDGRGATQLAERIRQKIAAAVMLVGDHEETLSVSCAAAQRGDESSSDKWLEHAAAALSEAKRYGRNRTFLSEGKHATPVVPPGLEVTGPRVVLRAVAGNTTEEPTETISEEHEYQPEA